MNTVLRQLHLWRFLERTIRLAWGAGRWFAIVGAILAVACLTDWLIDRYSGSQTWRDVLKSSWAFTNVDPLSAGETPYWFRFLMTAGQLALASGLVYVLLIRPWLRTPPVDEFAVKAEKAYPAFDHRLVTAIQLNRPKARTQGMSKTLIAAVTREAGEIAHRHNLLKLVDYRRLLWALVVVGPIVVAWMGFVSINSSLAGILVQRQMMPWAGIEIPRNIHLQNVTQEVWPSGSEVTIRYRVTGRFSNDVQGVVRVVPYYADLGITFDRETNLTVSEVKKDGAAKKAGIKSGDVIQKLDDVVMKDNSALLDRLMRKKPGDAVTLHVQRGEEQLDVEATLIGNYQPEEFYPLVLENPDWVSKEDGEEEAIFIAKLPASSTNLKFLARLGNGRTKVPDEVFFEPPPQVTGEDGVNALQVLPTYLGTDPDGHPFIRRSDGGVRGDLVDALPQSKANIEAKFNKPVKTARLIRIERGEGVRERELPFLIPQVVTSDRLSAIWEFPTTNRTIGYRIELVDDRGFVNPLPIRRNIRMYEDRPPIVEFKPESNRDPDPNSSDGKGNPKDYEWDAPVTPDGRIQVIFNTRSDLGIRAANIVYRVIPKGVAADEYPEEYKKIQHPREDKSGLVYNRLSLTPIPTTQAAKLGKFVPELGRFEKSGLFGEVELFAFPSLNPRDEPGELEAAGCKNFEVSGLLKKIPGANGKLTTAKLELGDTVELYVEVFDKLTVPGKDGKPVVDTSRPAGYTREAKRKIVVTEDDARIAIRLRDEVRQKLQDKLRDLATDQATVFKQKK